MSRSFDMEANPYGAVCMRGSAVEYYTCHTNRFILLQRPFWTLPVSNNFRTKQIA